MAKARFIFLEDIYHFYTRWKFKAHEFLYFSKKGNFIDEWNEGE